MNDKTTRQAAVVLGLAVLWTGLATAPLDAASQTAAEAAPVQSMPTAPAPLPAGRGAEPPTERGEPAVKYTVIEDEGARIDELRVRGQTQRITVTPKAGGKSVRPYEIISPTGSQSLQEAPNGVRGAAGKRVWHVLSF